MSLVEYARTLAGFDWYWSRSDDNRVASDGEAMQRRLRSISRISIAHKAVYEAYQNWAINGAPKPVDLPEELKVSGEIEAVMQEIMKIMGYRSAKYVFKTKAKQYDVLASAERIKASIQMLMHDIET